MADKRSSITPTLFFILANFTFGDLTPEIIVQSNGNFTLQPKVQGLSEDIMWTWNGNKVVEFDQKEVQDYGMFKGRTILNLTTGDLTLTHLTESDSGEYVCELLIEGQWEVQFWRVKVFDAVGKPAVTCQVNSTSVTLLCSGDNRTTTEYRWEGPAIEPQPGPQLEIKAAESSDSVYTCVLQNPVSQSRTDFPVKSCFPAPEMRANTFPVIAFYFPIFFILSLLSCYFTKDDERIAVIISSALYLIYFTGWLVSISFRKYYKKTSVIIPLLIVILLLLIINIILGLLLFYDKKCYKKRQDEEDVEVQSEELTRLQQEDSGVNGIVNGRVKRIEALVSPGKTSDAHQERTLSELPKGTDGSAGISQQSQAESLNVAVESEERVQTEGRNSPEHLSLGTVLTSAPVSPSAAPPKTGSEDNTNHPPESNLSPPHPPKSPSHSAQAPTHSHDQEEETESSDETGALVEKISKGEEDQLSHETCTENRNRTESHRPPDKPAITHKPPIPPVTALIVRSDTFRNLNGYFQI